MVTQGSLHYRRWGKLLVEFEGPARWIVVPPKSASGMKQQIVEFPLAKRGGSLLFSSAFGVLLLHHVREKEQCNESLCLLSVAWFGESH